MIQLQNENQDFDTVFEFLEEGQNTLLNMVGVLK
jgi:hypothetical protein